MLQKQKDVEDQTKANYGFIEYFRKAMEVDPCHSKRKMLFYQIKFFEGIRDYYSQSLKHINHLIQIDEKPNLEFMEPKWELYKISISFRAIGRSHQILNRIESVQLIIKLPF